MKRLSLGLSVLLVGVVLSGCVRQQSQEEQQTWEQAQVQEQAQSGVADWVSGLAAGRRMQCQYRMTGEDGKTTTVRMYADKSRYRTEAEMGGGTYVTVFDGETSYSWMIGKKEGTKMDMECMKEFQSSASEQPGKPDSYESSEDMIQSMPDITCEEVSGADFSVPSDVTFADQCEMMRSQLKMMEQYKNQMPENVRSMMGQ